jgi:glycine/D-amino acid oxidase-like deaminating enzyme/multidrug transporter EmrE-like cation transporter
LASELTLGVTLAVLGAGFLHAGWNALLKNAQGGEPMLDTATVVVGSAMWCLLVLPFVPLPDAAAWKFIAMSSVVHFGYYVTLSHAYRTGDLSFAYPLMRGTAPLITTVLGIVFLRELPSPQVATGIVLICVGIVSIAFVRRERHPPAALRWALANAALIAAYTLVDGAGVRASGNALSYVSWLLALEGLPYLAWVLCARWASRRRVHRPRSPPRRRRRPRQPRRVRDRAVGHDARARGRSGRAARDLGAVRGADRRGVAQGRLRRHAPGRRGERGSRNRDAQAMTTIPSHARVVVVGGGIAGASTAYHLAKLGVTDVLLLEQGKLTCGTTWHAAGLVGQTRATRNATRMSHYGIELYASLEKETGLATGWKQCGSLNVAASAQRLKLMRRQMARAQAFGVEFEFVSPQRAGEIAPILRTDDLTGAVWIPGDGKANPTDLTQSLARGARTRGARIAEGVQAAGITTHNGRVNGLAWRRGDETGTIACETIVNCAGQWAREFGRACGVTVPLASAEHFYIVTRPIAGVAPDLPVIRDPDGYIYYKEEVGGLVMGGFEPVAKPWNVPRIPDAFEFQLLQRTGTSSRS